MILAFDSYYFDQKAKTVCLAFENWVDSKVYMVYSEYLERFQEYKSGEFYRRELPCILSLLEKINKNTIEAIIVDGYVYLDDNLKLGLGGHLYYAMGATIPVIGVAKTKFLSIKCNQTPLLRGKSNRPLYITSIGLNSDLAAEKIKSMHGGFRIPTLLRELDKLTRVK